MSADSIIPYMYDTQAFNRYSYVKNNPLKYTDPSGHSWFKKQWKKLKKWTKKNWRKIAGAVLIVVGAVALYFPPIGLYVGPALMSLGASLIKYDPNEPDSPTNEIRVDVGTNGTPPINFDFNGDFQNQYTQDNDQGKYIVNNVTQGTHSTTTGNKFSNGGDSGAYNVTVGNNISYNPNTNGSITVGTITASNSNSGGNVLAVDVVENVAPSRNPFTRLWNQKSRIGNGIVRGFSGLLNRGLPQMWSNSPWYAKGLLVYSGGIFATPAIEVGAGYAYTHPLETIYGLEVVNDVLNPSTPPSTPHGSAINMGIEGYNHVWP